MAGNSKTKEVEKIVNPNSLFYSMYELDKEVNDIINLSVDPDTGEVLDSARSFPLNIHHAPAPRPRNSKMTCRARKRNNGWPR